MGSTTGSTVTASPSIGDGAGSGWHCVSGRGRHRVGEPADGDVDAFAVAGNELIGEHVCVVGQDDSDSVAPRAPTSPTIAQLSLELDHEGVTISLIEHRAAHDQLVGLLDQFAERGPMGLEVAGQTDEHRTVRRRVPHESVAPKHVGVLLAVGQDRAEHRFQPAGLAE